ncbi:MAG: hypothetical protein SV775_03450 [Thermodesulfobacteriota bacterium]|nr:hypothetical protein [Thermodesulfobacteriota bacterium]
MLIYIYFIYVGLALDRIWHLSGQETVRIPEKILEECILSALADFTHDFIHVHTKISDEAVRKSF